MCIPNVLSLNCRMFLIKTLYQFVKDSFVAPSVSVIKNSNIFHFSKETKSQKKARLSYLANSYFYNYKPSPRMQRQHRVLRNLRKNKDIVITKPDTLFFHKKSIFDPRPKNCVTISKKLFSNCLVYGQ